MISTIVTHAMADDITDTTQLDVPDVKVKDSFLWIKDVKGYGSVTLTFLTVAFWITTVAYVLGMFEGTIPWVNFKLRPFDVGASTSYLGLCTALYGGRKYTEARYK